MVKSQKQSFIMVISEFITFPSSQHLGWTYKRNQKEKKYFCMQFAKANFNFSWLVSQDRNSMLILFSFLCI